MATTNYKVGQKITDGSNNSFYLQVTNVYNDGTIRVKAVFPSGNEYHVKRIGSSSFTSVSNNGLFDIDGNGKFSMRMVKYSYAVKTVSPWSYFANMRNGELHYGSGAWVYKKNSLDKPHSDSWISALTNSGYSTKDWYYVEGTYNWGTTIKQGDWSGWTYKKNAYNGAGGVRNSYARKIKYNIKAKNPTKTNNDVTISINGIGILDTTRPDVIIYDTLPSKKITIPESPSVYTTSKNVRVNWAQDTTKFSYQVNNPSYTDINGNKSTVSIGLNTVLSKYGQYTFNVKATNKETTSISDTYTVIIRIEDPTPVPNFEIFDKNTTSIKYTLQSKVYLGPNYPTINVPSGCTLVSATLNGSAYTLGNAVTANGAYEIIVIVRKTTNNKQLSKTGLFVIDNIPPKAPIITVGDGNNYQGKDYGLVGRLPNAISMKIQVDSGNEVADRKVWFKKDLNATYVEIKSTSNQMTLSDKGVYKITARAKKNNNGLYSEYTTIEVYKKIKYTWTISLNPNDLCYRTIATVNFVNDETLKTYYKIDDLEWVWYRDPVKIYQNCKISVKSNDGDDNYESNITTKIIDIIDTKPPTIPVILGVTEGEVRVGSVTPTAN